MAAKATAAVDEKQPKGLYVLFSAEAWERFSYYGMRALLVLYLVNHLQYDREDALEIYGLYTGLVYLTPLIGGYLADRYLGARKAVLIGGTVMALGHLAMAFEPLLFEALGLLIVGNGFFKPNISTIVGGLYHENDPRRDGGFTIFYMGINLGAFFSPIVCGTLGENIGWHWGFGAAGIGMIAGLLVFIWGQRLLGSTGFPPGREVGADTRLTPQDWRDVVLHVLGCTALVWAVVHAGAYVGKWPMLIGGGIVGFVGLAAALGWDAAHSKAEPLSRDDYLRMAVIAILAFFNIFFWMGFEQAGGTMTLFADKQTDRHLFGWEIPASLFQSINPFVIVTLAPVFSVLWKRIDQSRYAISTPAKMAIGMILLGCGFVVMFVAQGIAAETGTVGPLWLVTVYFLHTVGELCLSPIGLSMVTKLSPARFTSIMMGVWFLSSAVANYSAGTLEAFLTRFHIPLYGFLIFSSIGAGVILLLITPFLKRWMGGRG